MGSSRPVVVLERLLAVVGVACLGWYGYISVDAAYFQREQTAAFERLLALAPSASAAARAEVPASSGETSPKRSEGREDGPQASAVARAEVPASFGETSPKRPESHESGPPASAVARVEDVPASFGETSPKRPEDREGGPSALLSSLPSALAANLNLIGMLDIPRLRLSTPVMTGDDDKTLQVAVGHLPDTPRPWEPGNSAIAAHRDGLFRPLKNIRIGDALRVRTTRGNLQYTVRDIKIVSPDDLSVLQHTAAQTLTLITCYPFNYIGAAPKRFIVRAERIPD